MLILLLVCGLLRSPGAETEGRQRIKAIVFDAFPIFDPRPLDALAVEMFPEKGKELMRLWRTRQFEYQWLRGLGGEYRDFREITEDALVFAARELGIPLTDDARRKLLSPYDGLPAWPDAKAALGKLKADGYKIVFLSNMTEKMLRSGLAASGLEGEFDQIYSTDSRKTFKPAREAYQIALDGLHLSREEILFVAFAGWDASGAKWFGYPTFWVNRTGASREELGNEPDGTGRDLRALLEFLEDGANGQEAVETPGDRSSGTAGAPSGGEVLPPKSEGWQVTVCGYMDR